REPASDGALTRRSYPARRVRFRCPLLGAHAGGIRALQGPRPCCPVMDETTGSRFTPERGPAAGAPAIPSRGGASHTGGRPHSRPPPSGLLVGALASGAGIVPRLSVQDSNL